MVCGLLMELEEGRIFPIRLSRYLPAVLSALIAPYGVGLTLARLVAGCFAWCPCGAAQTVLWVGYY